MQRTDSVEVLIQALKYRSRHTKRLCTGRARRARRALAQHPEICTIGELLLFSEQELLARKPLGYDTVERIRDVLSGHGLSLKPSTPPPLPHPSLRSLREVRGSVLAALTKLDRLIADFKRATKE